MLNKFPSVSRHVSARKLDQFGIHYIEGGWPGSNPKDVEFFQRAPYLGLNHAKITAFGSTRRKEVRPEEDANLRLLLDAETPVVTLVGKSWDLHAEQVLRISLDDNLRIIEESVRYLKAQGREVIYDAEKRRVVYQPVSIEPRVLVPKVIRGGKVDSVNLKDIEEPVEEETAEEQAD